MLITPDFSEVKGDIEPGEYQVRVVKGEPGEWNNDRGTTKYINWHLETCNSADPSENGRYVFHKTPYTGKGAFRLQNFYKAATGSAIQKDQSFSTEELLGRELIVVVDKNDKGYLEVKAEKAVQ